MFASLTVPQAIVQEFSLSFLGVGAQSPQATWGSLAADGVRLLNPIRCDWWLVVFPCPALSVTLLALNLLGDGRRDALDVRTALLKRSAFRGLRERPVAVDFPAGSAYPRRTPLGISVTVARLTLDQLVQVRILDPQLTTRMSITRLLAVVCELHLHQASGLGKIQPRA